LTWDHSNQKSMFTNDLDLTSSNVRTGDGIDDGRVGGDGDIFSFIQLNQCYFKV